MLSWCFFSTSASRCWARKDQKGRTGGGGAIESDLAEEAGSISRSKRIASRGPALRAVGLAEYRRKAWCRAADVSSFSNWLCPKTAERFQQGSVGTFDSTFSSVALGANKYKNCHFHSGSLPVLSGEGNRGRGGHDEGFWLWKCFYFIYLFIVACSQLDKIQNIHMYHKGKLSVYIIFNCRKYCNIILIESRVWGSSQTSVIL